ncbi:MAG TPA: amidohydrolase family protein [Pyrinomonadaceae bacterium]|jgi:imidazolonepropionase-like amidohydrolase
MRKIFALLVATATLAASLVGAAAQTQPQPQRRGGQRRGGQPTRPESGTPSAADSASTVGAAGDVLIRNATILTASHGTLNNADILIRKGKIAAVGASLRAGSDVRVVDATGRFVTPGIIDCHSHTALDAINEGTLSVTSMVRTRDAFNPTDINVYRALAGGVTAQNSLHGSANTIGGQNIVMKMKYGRPAAEWLFGAPPGIKFALGENVKRSNVPNVIVVGQPQAPRRYPATRMGQEEVLRDAFTRARNYKRDWDDYRAAQSRGERNAIPPRRDLQMEPLVEVLEGKRFVHAHSYRSDEILMLMNIAEEFGFRVKTLQHVLEGYKIAPEIARHGAGASTFADFWGYKLEAYDAIPYNTAIMTRAGVVSTVNSDDAGRARRLNIDAAKMMKYGGLSEQEALRTVTLNAAIQLGIDARTGSIDVGKDADLAIWNGHPFSVYSRVDQTYVDGELFFDREQDIRNRAALERERQELEKAEPNQAPGGAPAGAPRPNRRPGGHDDDDGDGGNDNR